MRRRSSVSVNPTAFKTPLKTMSHRENASEIVDALILFYGVQRYYRDDQRIGKGRLCWPQLAHGSADPFQDTNVVSDRHAAHVIDAADPGVLDLDRVRHDVAQLHGTHYMH